MTTSSDATITTPRSLEAFEHGPNRLLWNFEINPASAPLPLTMDSANAAAPYLKWEARFFWPETSIITLQGLDQRYLSLSQYRYKHREDTYFLSAPLTFNVKQRGDNLIYKPLLAEADGLCGFDKKINLHATPNDSLLPGIPQITVAELLLLLRKATPITVNKEVVLYRFSTTPVVKLELSRLNVGTKTYFSVCLESSSAALIKEISEHLLPKELSCHYMSFLSHNLV